MITKRIGKDGKPTYLVRVEGGVDPLTGARRRPARTVRTKREADALEAHWQTELANGVAVDPSRITTGEYLIEWLRNAAQDHVRRTTFESYESLIRVRLLPAIGTIPLQKLTALHLQKAYTDMRQGERHDNKRGTLSARTIRYSHAVLKMALKQAVQWRYVPHNVAEDVRPPKAERPQIAFWTADQAQTFLAAAVDARYSPLWLVALSTGLRKGELLGLRWCDVDLVRGVLQVRQQVQAVKCVDSTQDRLIVQEPKTRAGRRTVTLPAPCIEALARHLHRRPERPLPLDPSQRDTDPVFCTSIGTLIDPRNVTTQFDLLVRTVDVPPISFHGMRHTHATLLLAGGVNVKAVSARLGHASIQITLDTYLHVMPEMEQHAAQAIEQALSVTG